MDESGRRADAAESGGRGGSASAFLRQNAIGLLALFFSLCGGTAMALDGSNTVFSDDIVNQEVGTADLAPAAVSAGKLDANSVHSGKVVNDTLRSEDILDGQIRAIDVAFGTLRGDEILDGTIGGNDLVDNGVSGVDIDEGSLGEVPAAEVAQIAGGLLPGAVRADSIGPLSSHTRVVEIPGGAAHNGAYNTDSVSAPCQSGELAIGGETAWSGNAEDLELFIGQQGLVGLPPHSYQAWGGNDSGVTKTLLVTVICLRP